MFIITANKTRTFGVFSTLEKAKEAIEILVERYRKTEDYDDHDLEWMCENYRSYFKVIPLPCVDNLDFFQKGEIPYF